MVGPSCVQVAQKPVTGTRCRVQQGLQQQLALSGSAIRFACLTATFGCVELDLCL